MSATDLLSPVDGSQRVAVPLIKARGLGKSYGRALDVLHDVNLSIGERERVALIGPNGAGKSTLLKCLVSLHAHTAGDLSVLGETLGRPASSRQRRAIRRQTGFVMQQSALVGRLSALSNVVQGRLGLPGGWRAIHQTIAPAALREMSMAALDAVSLAHKAGDRADQLSGGQAQRVSIARALVREPRLLIADEPAASLDPAAGEEVMANFSEQAKARGLTLLFTSHDLSHALSFADRVIALKAGRIVVDAPTASVSQAELRTVFDD